ncbi:MAG: AAA family ATPase, partial [Acidobacteriota bacterium]
MTEPLFLESLEIQQFRAFDHLRIERLGRVNLIVGKNNVGKSSLLEALWLYAYQGHPVIVWGILERRDEGTRPRSQNLLRGPQGGEDENIEHYSETIERLFYRNSNGHPKYDAKIGPAGLADKTLTLALGTEKDNKTNDFVTVIETQFNNQPPDIFFVNVSSYRLRNGNREQCVMVTANGLDIRTAEKFWDNVALTSLEDDVLGALRIIAPNVERVNLLAGRRGNTGRTPIVKLAGVNDPVPLRSLGEGMNRMFSIALALVNARGGMLL